ncbi:MAG: hypothetical protein R3D69_19230 [Xanthobacteraceae bacterium]
MTFFLIFAPFLAFAALSWVVSTTASVFAAAAIGAAILAADAWRGASPKPIGLAATATFRLSASPSFAEVESSNLHVRMGLDAVLLALALASIALRKPFTLAYAREQVDEDTRKPLFLSVNYHLSWVWAGAIALMLVADLAPIYVPWMPLWIGALATFALRNSAIQISKWYPQRVQGNTAATRA